MALPSRSPSSSPFARGRTTLKKGGCCLRSSPCKGEDRWGSAVSPPAQTSGLARTIRVSCSPAPSGEAVGAAGAVALRLMICRWLRNGALPPAAPDRVFSGHLERAQGPGSSLPAPREHGPRAFHTKGASGEALLPCVRTRRIPNLPSQAHPGLTCLGLCRTVHLPQSPSCP